MNTTAPQSTGLKIHDSRIPHGVRVMVLSALDVSSDIVIHTILDTVNGTYIEARSYDRKDPDHLQRILKIQLEPSGSGRLSLVLARDRYDREMTIRPVDLTMNWYADLESYEVSLPGLKFRLLSEQDAEHNLALTKIGQALIYSTPSLEYRS